MTYYLGLDQGGTKTAAAVCDINGNILGTGYDQGLATVYFCDDAELYIERIKSASKKACDMAGISLSDVTAVCGGLNGADWDFEIEILTEKLRSALNIQDSIVLNDCIIAMRGGGGDISKDCAIVCAGTGLNVAVRRNDGEEIIYGYYIDQAHQGAEALGNNVFSKVMESHIGICGETALTDLVLTFTGHSDPEHLMIEHSTGKYALDKRLLAPFLTQAYIEGDFESVSIMNTFLKEVAAYVITASKKLDMLESPLDIVLSGSVFKGDGKTTATKLFEIIRQDIPNANLIHARYEPVCGAILTLLDREYNSNLPLAVKENIEESAQRHGLLRNSI